MTNLRIGQGYDVHRLTEGRALILGGVTIPYEKGLLGHSDADVLTHAVMDGAQARALPRANAREHRRDAGDRRFAREREGDDGGAPRLHRQRRGNGGACRRTA